MLFAAVVIDDDDDDDVERGGGGRQLQTARLVDFINMFKGRLTQERQAMDTVCSRGLSATASWATAVEEKPPRERPDEVPEVAAAAPSLEDAPEEAEDEEEAERSASTGESAAWASWMRRAY